MVVHHPCRLHERVADGGTDEAEATTLERLAHRLGDRSRSGDVLESSPGVDDRRAAGELPQELREPGARLAQIEPGAGVADRGTDLQAVAHDARVFKERVDLPLAVARDALRVEAVERLGVGLALLQDGVPAQSRLRALENQHLEEPAVVANRHAPLLVVVGDVERVVVHPAAARRSHVPILPRSKRPGARHHPVEYRRLPERSTPKQCPSPDLPRFRGRFRTVQGTHPQRRSPIPPSRRCSGVGWASWSGPTRRRGVGARVGARALPRPGGGQLPPKPEAS